MKYNEFEKLKSVIDRFDDLEASVMALQHRKIAADADMVSMCAKTIGKDLTALKRAFLACFEVKSKLPS